MGGADVGAGDGDGAGAADITGGAAEGVAWCAGVGGGFDATLSCDPAPTGAGAGFGANGRALGVIACSPALFSFGREESIGGTGGAGSAGSAALFAGIELGSTLAVAAGAPTAIEAFVLTSPTREPSPTPLPASERHDLATTAPMTSANAPIPAMARFLRRGGAAAEPAGLDPGTSTAASDSR